MSAVFITGCSKLKYKWLGSLLWHKFRTEFHENRQLNSKAEMNPQHSDVTSIFFLEEK
jgi:hypothetical protein